MLDPVADREGSMLPSVCEHRAEALCKGSCIRELNRYGRSGSFGAASAQEWGDSGSLFIAGGASLLADS